MLLDCVRGLCKNQKPYRDIAGAFWNQSNSTLASRGSNLTNTLAANIRNTNIDQGNYIQKNSGYYQQTEMSTPLFFKPKNQKPKP